MAIASIAEAQAQYAANLSWQDDPASAKAALEAVRYLLAFRAQHVSDAGTTFNYESLEKEKAALEKFVGATAPRSFGRSRRNGVAFGEGGIG